MQTQKPRSSGESFLQAKAREGEAIQASRHHEQKQIATTKTESAPGAAEEAIAAAAAEAESSMLPLGLCAAYY